MKGRDVLIASSVVQEMRHAPDLIPEIPSALRGANLYLLSHTTKFWECDAWHFMNVDKHPRNVLEAYPLPDAFFEQVASHPGFIRACEDSEARVRREYEARVQPDLSADLDERKLLPVIWSRASRLVKEMFRIDLPVADCRSDNFPSFFVYEYAYYFWYVKSGTGKIELNDFHDIGHAIASPYCRDFFTERRLAAVLRNDVQGRQPPPQFSASKLLHREGVVDAGGLTKAKESEAMRRPMPPMLPCTRIWSLAEMRQTILEA